MIYIRPCVENIIIILKQQTKHKYMSVLHTSFSEQVPEDVIRFIMSGLNMFDLTKLGHVNKYYYKLSEMNEYWEIFYEKLFNRTYIDEKSVHNGDVTWWTCKVGSYPGWSRIHTPINNSGQQCRIRSHYSCLCEKKTKIKYKNYKKMAMKRYRTLILSDSLIKTTTNDSAQLKYYQRARDRAQHNVEVLEKKISKESNIKLLFNKSEESYKNIDNKPKKKTKKKKDSNTPEA